MIHASIILDARAGSLYSPPRNFDTRAVIAEKLVPRLPPLPGGSMVTSVLNSTDASVVRDIPRETRIASVQRQRRGKLTSMSRASGRSLLSGHKRVREVVSEKNRKEKKKLALYRASIDSRLAASRREFF